MSTLKDKEEESLSPIIRTPQLKLLTGGKGPTEPVGYNWLADLEQGTIFLGKMRKVDTFELTRYKLLFKFLASALIRGYLPERQIDFYVDMKQFSKDVDKFEVIGIEGEEADETEE